MKNNIKNCICFMMVMILSLSTFINIYAEEVNWEKYKSFKYTEMTDTEVGIFYYNGKKTKITIPAKIKGLKVSTVNILKAKGLKSIKLSRYVKIVYLAKNRTLKKVTVDKKNKYLSVKNNMVLNKKGTKLKTVLGGYDEITVPKSVKTVEVASFSGSKVKKVTFQKNVKKINSPFTNSKKLEKIVFKGNSIPKIKEESFGHVDNLDFHVNSKKLADDLLEELRDNQFLYVRIYVDNELIHEEQLKWVY